MAKVKTNFAGLPADRRDKGPALMGVAPADKMSLAGSGYEKSWAKPTTGAPGAKITKNKGNGSK